MKKILALILAIILVMSMVVGLSSCGSKGSSKGGKDATLKVGVILVGDEGEGYTKAHMDGIEAAAAALTKDGKPVEIQWKKNIPEDEKVKTNALDLIADGCTLIISNSYGHQFHFGDVIEEYPDVTFVAMTGDLAAGSGLNNYFNAFTRVYESRYVSGVVAGLKLKELLDEGKLSQDISPNSYDAEGNIKIGYVGAYEYAEVVSGYTSFYLGIKSIVENVSMTVKYTNSWFNEEREAAVAEYLMGIGCVIIGQHADSTGAPAAVQKAYNNNKDNLCFSIGYNVSMLETAPDVALTSAGNNWGAYYEVLFRALIDKTDVPADWAEGFSSNAVDITELGSSVAKGTKEKVDDTVKKIKDGSLKVFDCSTFTVGGKNLTSYIYNSPFGSSIEGMECIKSEGSVYYFDDSSLRSAPYFDIRIDNVVEIKSEYEPS